MGDLTCCVPDCSKPIRYIGRRLCGMHNARLRTTGSLELGPRPTMEERFWAKVVKSDYGCWGWVGAKNHLGYGQMWVDGKKPGAHRISYQLHYGVDPAGYDVDHICGIPECTRPDHLRLLTHQQNGEHRVKMDSRNTSGHRGVSFDKKKGLWYTYCTVRGKRYSAGSFADLEEAAEAIRLLRLRVMSASDRDVVVPHGTN